jgi:hypothetical protein
VISAWLYRFGGSAPCTPAITLENGCLLVTSSSMPRLAPGHHYETLTTSRNTLVIGVFAATAPSTEPDLRSFRRSRRRFAGIGPL